MKFNFSKTPLGMLRMVGIAEGISFLVLLGIAMPLKYLAGIPLAVKLAGWTHGLLFIFFAVSLSQVKQIYNWPLKKAFIAFVAALLPFGTFVLDKSLRQEEKELLADKKI